MGREGLKYTEFQKVGKNISLLKQNVLRHFPVALLLNYKWLWVTVNCRLLLLKIIFICTNCDGKEWITNINLCFGLTLT